jgi:phosphopantothenoylcysteine synthetase/decarboxylase
MKLNVIVTSGGTREHIDDVRVLTNISTGKLGSKIARVFLDHGHNVTYVCSPTAVRPTFEAHNLDVKTVVNTQSVMEAMKELVPHADVVIHSMAVSDFTFNLTGAIKIGSDSPEALIEHMRKTITKTPKVISHFRDWNPKAILVGFKFTVGKSKKELEEIAAKLMLDNRLDMVFANDKMHMQNAGDHVGTLLMKDWSEQLHSKEEIAEAIYANVVRIL